VTSVTGRVVEGKEHNMATANKLGVLQKVKQEKGVPFWSFWNDLEKNKQTMRSGKQWPRLLSH